jgi:hypothetical protein
MDRTAEFKAAVNSLLNRGHLQHRQPYGQTNGQARKGKEFVAYMEFSQLAYRIGKDISETSSKLQKLTKCK